MSLFAMAGVALQRARDGFFPMFMGAGAIVILPIFYGSLVLV
jgi:hypothetical protein